MDFDFHLKKFIGIFATEKVNYANKTSRCMKNFSLLFISILFLVSCNQQKHQTQTEYNPKSKFRELLQPIETQICVFADPDKTFQTLLGIGGALTDASAETFAKMPEAKQQEFLLAYFDKQKGIGYTLARTNINSCDFSSGSYTYVSEGDRELKSFSIDHDMKFRIPFIKKAIAAAGGNLTLLASPWSPPAYMKLNKDMLHGGKLNPEFSQPWANYYSKPGLIKT